MKNNFHKEENTRKKPVIRRKNWKWFDYISWSLDITHKAVQTGIDCLPIDTWLNCQEKSSSLRRIKAIICLPEFNNFKIMS